MLLQINTFQCVITSDGNSSFVFFLYPEGGLQWTAGDLQGNRGERALIEEMISGSLNYAGICAVTSEDKRSR